MRRSAPSLAALLPLVLTCAAWAGCLSSSSGSPVGADPEQPGQGPDGGGVDGAQAPGGGGGAPDGGAPPSSSGPVSPGAPLTNCPSCKVHVPPGYDVTKPTRLLVALHGDEGRDFGLDSATDGVVGLWQGAADASNFILFAPACPAALGCDGAFSDWLAADGYDPSPASLGWLDAQVTELEARYNIDTKGEYLAGHSGGAYWLGAYAPARATRFAAVAFVAGGMPAYHALHGCPARALPGFFLGGDMDPRTGGQMSDTASAFNACGEPIELKLVEGADHGATIASLASGNAAVILGWFATHALP